MRYRAWIVAVLSCLYAGAQAQEVSHTAADGSDSVPAAFFRIWYHRSDLIYYLEALNDHTIVETHATGQWWLPDRLNVAVEGLPCTMTGYEIDGVRVEDRFAPGNTVYVTNMQRYDLILDTHSGRMRFSLDSAARDYAEVRYNFGQVGNGAPAAGTTAIINISHRSAMQSAETWKHITDRRHQAGAGTADAAYSFRDKQGNAYRQHLYAVYGQRLLTKEDETGLILNDPLYRAQYYKVQADGVLPVKPNRAFEQLGYRLNFSGKEDGGSEYLYNFNEVFDIKNYSGQLFLKRRDLKTSLIYACNTVRHTDLEFARNVIDQDGESFSPWVADGQTHEVGWTVKYDEKVWRWLSVHVDAYNSLFYFRPDREQFQNEVYLRSPIATSKTDLYRYEWESRAYVSGLLENTVGLSADYTVDKNLDIHGRLDFTLDALLLGGGKSKVSPNWQALFVLDVHPCKWFEMGVSFGHQRVPFTTDYLRFFSNDYMNAKVYQAGTNKLLMTTGGRYHTYASGLGQTSYFELQIPIRFRFQSQHGQHEIVLQNNYRKFFNVWHTCFDGAPADYGFYQNEDGKQIYYLNPGEQYYRVSTTPGFGSNFLMNSPYYFSQLTRYTYTGRKVTVGISWQSMQAAGYTGLGNGANSNTIGVLSETTANPNTTNVVANQGAKYPGVSRMDLDKGFVARFYLGYNICKWLQAGLTIKWTDGKPFTSYHYYYDHNQVALLPETSRGTNPTDGNFGTRHGAVYNFDLHLQGKWQVKETTMRLNVECYNIWDFCHDLAEMAFVQDIPQATRASVILTVPTGIIATFGVDL